MTFDKLNLIEPLTRLYRRLSRKSPTPNSNSGNSCNPLRQRSLGCAQTGTGKTAAFALPILQRRHNESKPDPKLKKKSAP